MRYLVRSLGSSLFTIFGVMTLTFLVVNLLPGDAVAILLINSPKEYLEPLRHALGLDLPLHIRYINWLVPLVTRLDMGRAIVLNAPVNKLVIDRLPVTVELTMLAMLLSLVIATPLGIVAAGNRGKWPDYLAIQFSQFGQAVPSFWIGTLLFLLLGVKLHLLPSAGWVPLTVDVRQNMLHLIMPAISLALPQTAILTRTVRSSMLEVLGQPYITTAYAKGLPAITVLYRHALRNALIPVLTIAGVQMGYLLGGSVIIEDIFQLPGIGKLSVQSLNWRDIPVLQGCLLFYATFFVVINLAVDILYPLLDPRISFE